MRTDLNSVAKARRGPPDNTIRKTIRIAVSGDVLLTALELTIIDTPDFQRLRNIRQLGTLPLVYPTALHTRFDHSLGVLAMADRMITAIRRNTASTRDEKTIGAKHETLIRLYALLHDITHVPYGHTIEDELSLLKRHDQNQDRIQRFLGTNSEIGRIISSHLGHSFHERLLSIYRWDGKDPTKLANRNDAFVYDLVSNTVCADLLDYLARDSYFCNLNIDIEYRFLNFLYIGRLDGAPRIHVRLWKTRLTQPRRDTLTDLTRLLDARYLAAERAYFHHAKIISGAMLVRALQEALTAKEIVEEDLYAHGDDSLLRLLQRSSNECAARLANGLASRRLHRLLEPFRAEDLSAAQNHDQRRNVGSQLRPYMKSPKRRRQLEDALAAEVGARPGDVLLYIPRRRRAMNMKPAEMLVRWRDESMQLQHVPDRLVKPRLRQIREAHRQLWGIYVIVARTLSDDQAELVRAGCQARLLRHPKSEGVREYYEKLVTYHLGRMDVTVALAAKEIPRVIREAGKALSETSDDSGAFETRIRAAIQEHLR